MDAQPINKQNGGKFEFCVLLSFFSSQGFDFPASALSTSDHVILCQCPSAVAVYYCQQTHFPFACLQRPSGSLFLCKEF